MEVRAKAKNVGISPRKVERLVAAIRGKRAKEALTLLQFTPTPHAKAVAKTLRSAMANAENTYMLDSAELKVTIARADPGPTQKRVRPRARGRADRMTRRTTHITVVLGEE